MKIEDQQDQFQQQLRSILDAGAYDLDDEIRQRLRNARREAVSKAQYKDAWSLVPMFSLASVAGICMLVITLWSSPMPMERTLVSQFDDLELLTTKDDLEFIADLEFYQWLEQQS
jgi:hypothetical protein